MVVVERFGGERSRGRRGLEVRNEDEGRCGSGRQEYETGTPPERCRRAKRLSRYEQISDGLGVTPCHDAALTVLVFHFRLCNVPFTVV